MIICPHHPNTATDAQDPLYSDKILDKADEARVHADFTGVCSASVLGCRTPEKTHDHFTVQRSEDNTQVAGNFGVLAHFDFAYGKARAVTHREQNSRRIDDQREIRP
jgi:hypothetical protein